MILGNGIDIVSVKKVESALKKWGDAFIDKVFNPIELQYIKKDKMYAQRVASRFAVKEAVIKSVGRKHQIFLKDVIVEKEPTGAPVCTINGYPDIEVLISLSHIQEYAVASAIAQKKN